MIPPKLQEFAQFMFSAVGGDPSTWSDKANLGLWSLAITTTILALVTASAAMAMRDGA